MSKNPFVGFRLAPAELANLDSIATARGCSRSEAARIALSFGIPLAAGGHSFNITRIVLLIEYMQAAIDVLIASEHADVVPTLRAAAKDRVATYHG